MANDVPSTTFIPPSVSAHLPALLSSQSYTHSTPLPSLIHPTSSTTEGTPCCLGIDEAGRGPVLGPMIYGAFYLPIPLQQSLLATDHHFDDSKVLTPSFRTHLMTQVCTPSTALHDSCGWAIRSLSAADIGAGMLSKQQYNLNAQAMDATIDLIKGIMESGVNVKEVYIDTIGQPEVYQRRLEKVFPTTRVRVEKKADSLFPVVSAASVVAKVTRDVSCEVLWEEYKRLQDEDGGEYEESVSEVVGWGSGYPSDARCVSWLKSDIDPLFGWGGECRLSWGTVKDLLEAKGVGNVKVEWPVAGDDENMQLSNYFSLNESHLGGAGGGGGGTKTEEDELRNWFGTRVGQEAF